MRICLDRDETESRFNQSRGVAAVPLKGNISPLDHPGLIRASGDGCTRKRIEGLFDWEKHEIRNQKPL